MNIRPALLTKQPGIGRRNPLLDTYVPWQLAQARSKLSVLRATAVEGPRGVSPSFLRVQCFWADFVWASSPGRAWDQGTMHADGWGVRGGVWNRSTRSWGNRLASRRRPSHVAPPIFSRKAQYPLSSLRLRSTDDGVHPDPRAHVPFGKSPPSRLGISRACGKTN
ncbi:hypothetical protein LX32DRAFT_70801 [Colletotrichum zoysiae]|uniref:Uncharacterized protein n=1 Tax=Colletotrichum zoysiae TaxID=1216348 RepID=A0AAD9H9Q7_9PEZI|nr:hypothetical protein LX32DRAFT_70801 [Colletotrichum zoysiae]